MKLQVDRYISVWVYTYRRVCVCDRYTHELGASLTQCMMNGEPYISELHSHGVAYIPVIYMCVIHL